jgi:hypothetical protein
VLLKELHSAFAAVFLFWYSYLLHNECVWAVWCLYGNLWDCRGLTWHREGVCPPGGGGLQNSAGSSTPQQLGGNARCYVTEFTERASTASGPLPSQGPIHHPKSSGLQVQASLASPRWELEPGRADVGLASTYSLVDVWDLLGKFTGRDSLRSCALVTFSHEYCFFEGGANARSCCNTRLHVKGGSVALTWCLCQDPLRAIPLRSPSTETCRFPSC